MNYNANVPDWHQYNSSQSGINDVTSTAQNVNSGHFSFISSISPTQLNSLNLSSEGHEKHQTDPNFNSRHFQPHVSANISHGHNAADNAPPLTSMVQMQNCIGHYGPSNTRNPMVENLNGSMDPRNTALSNLNEELGYRNNQMPLNGPISHLNGPNVMNMNVPHGSIGPRNTNMNSHTANRTGPPSFVSCKGLCCNPDPNINYQQWDKYCTYQNNTAYRENIRSSAYQTDTRRFGNDLNFRKDNFDGKEVSSSIVPNAPTADHRRNFPDFKYRKDRLLSRSYPPATGMLPNYSMQNYNYTGEYQKYPYNVKEYSKMNSMSIPNQGMVKHQELSFMAQQKYNNKQTQYQNNAMMSTSSMPSGNVNPNMIPSAQNAYCFNPQYSRNLSTETSHDQETADNVSMMNRMQTSMTAHAPHPRYQMYQQKIAMQKFSMENHLKEMTRIPGYQSHPKYKECVLRYREILKLQQSVTCQGQIQQIPCVTASTVNTSVPPINLRFDQNGVLINSNYMPEAFPRVQQTLNTQAPIDNSDKQSKQEHNNIPEMANVHKQPEQLVPQQHDSHTTVLCSESLRKQDRYPIQKDQSQFEVQKTSNENFGSVNASDGTIVQRPKKFADKPELDVRQFLANWDESEDEDSVSSNMPDIVLSNSTPVVVVGYENVDLSAKTLVDGLDGSKSEEIQSNVITFQNQDKINADTTSAQNCLTISYSAAGNVEISKDICKQVPKESIVQPGSIIQCISNGPDEVPTIHIVENLEISNILRVTGGQVAETLEQQNAMTFFHEKTKVETAAITLQNDKFKSNDTTYEATEPITEYNADIENLSKEKYIVEKPSPPKTVESDRTSQTSQTNSQRELPISSVSTKNNLDSAQDINLKKQSSFTSEESHNPDDISLPDLPTSECTPISTTLNTPIHSDSEESSERVEDLTISTNPIEVVQNSPIISFTQSPMRGEPYDHLNEERTVKDKSEVPLETQYRVEDRFKDDGNNMLNHDTVIGTFEFSTNIDKNESTVSARDDKEHASPNGNATASNEETSILDSETKSTEVASACTILTSGEYELQTISTDMQSKLTQDYKHSTIERRIYESQTVAIQDVQVIRKTLQTLSETDAEVPFRYNDTVELDKALENITSNTDSIEHDAGNDNVDNAKVYEERLLKISKKESKPCAISSINERKCISPELTCQTKVTSISSTSLSTSTITNDITSRNSKLTVENSCLTKTAKSNPPVSRDMKYSALNNDKLKKNERLADDISAKEIVPAEKNANDNRSSKINAKDLKNFRHVNLTDHKKSTSSNSMDLSNKKYLFEDTAEKCNETIIHPDEHSDIAKEVTTYKIKSNHCTAEDLKESNNSKNESKVIDKNVDNNRERLRLLKEYRRMKSNIPGIGQNQNKDQDMQKVSDYEASKGYSLSNLGEESMSQTLSDKELCQDTKSKPSEEQERKHAILKTFVSKNVKPDFAIQVTNVNLKLKDDHQKDLQRIGEEAKNSSSSLDAIKIEINVSCTERNTTEKLLHENIKNAVAETIGHLTNSISNGARSNSTNLTEIQCDKMITCDKPDSRDYDIYKRSLPSSAETCVYNDARKNQDNAEKEIRRKSEMIEREESLTNDETPVLLVSKKRRSSSLERELMNNIREDKGNVNVESELASGVLEASKPEQIKRRNVHQNAEKRIAATNVCLSIEESMISENSSYVSSMFRNVGAQKKERQDVFLCKNAKNLQDSVSSRLNAGPSTSSNIANPGSESASYNNFTYFDYNHFDVAPNESVDADDKRTDRWRRSKRDDGKLSNCDLYETPNGYINPTFFSIDEPKDLNRVPVYITKDGKITYSPNPRFTYRELITEARTKEGHDNMRELYFPSFDYYDCSKLRKVFKRNRNVNSASKKKEIDPIDIKPQLAAGHTNYLSNKNTTHKNIYCAKTRSASHLELFNDADKSYTSRSNQQESKESNKRNVVDLNLLDKPCDADNEPNAKYCKTKIFADNLDHENKYNESFLFDSILFPEPKIPPCWEETMESVKSYSSHIDRRNSDNRKELNFSEIFAVQRRSNSPSFLSEEQNFSDGKCNRKTNNNRNMSNELRLPRTTCSYIDDLCLLQDGDSHCKRLDTVSCNDQEDRNNDNVVSAIGLDNKFADMHNAPLRKEYEKKQETQFDKTESDALISTERTRSHSPKAIEEKLTKVLEKDQNPTSYIEDKKTLTGSIVKDDMHVHCLVPSNKDTCDTADINTEQSSAEVISSPKSSVDSNNLPDKLKCTEIIMKSPTFVLKEQTNKINDSVKNSSDFTISDQVTYQVSSVLADCKDREEILPTIESDVSHEIYFNEANGRNDTRDRGNFLVCKGKELIASQNLPNVALVSQLLDDERNEPRLKTLENKGQTAGSVSKNQENDEVDNCDSVISKPTVVADLHAIATEEICDIFTNQKQEQNISEFTVIKSIIQSDKKPYPEDEMGKNLKNCDNIIDTKLLCIGSSDCGIYVEDQCVLTDMSEHDFTEDDSRVPMEWETNQIQEDAVNHLCSIDESSIDFAGATNSLRSGDNSLLDNLSLARSVVKESPVLISEMENKSNEPAPVIESKALMLCNDEDREQDRVSCSGYEKVAYLRATDCNANTRMVPKLVIKKTEVSSKCITKVSSPSVTDNIPNKSVLKLNCQPKIPKMIIRNARSRPGTPSIEAVTEKMSAQVNLSNRTLPYMAHNETREELFENDSESSLQGSVSQNKNKIPKMKIKLDENYSNKIIIAEDTVEHYVKRKNMKKTIPKVKIKNSSGSDLPDNSICNIASSQESKDLGKYEEKIPILKLKKQESNRSSSPEETEYGIRKRQNSSHSEVPFKKCKKLGREETEHSTRHSDSPRAILAECETKKSPLVRISEKIPKVIIKRTSANAEFKCELSKGCKSVIAKSAKWQPEVKLERYRILDSMVKDLKTSSLTPISLQIIDKIFTNRKNNCRPGKKDDYNHHRLSRSNSTSELLPVKCKQRRMSDYDCKRTSGELKDDVSFSPTRIIDSEDTKMSDTKKDKSSRGYNDKSSDEYQKDNKYGSKSRDNNSETDVTVSCDKEINRSMIGRLISADYEQIMKTDEDSSLISIKLDQKDIFVEHSKSTNFKNVLKELKATSKLETCFVKLPSLDEISSTRVDSQTDGLRESKEQENDSFSSKDNKIVVKKERLNSCSDNACTIQDIVSLKDDPASILDNSEDSNSVIKIDSSDESQTTIEILPASPDGNRSESRMIEDGDSEQLYPADAIPTQFELELEITDNSNIDLLDASMPKLDPVTCGSRCVSNDENCSDRTPKIACSNKSESLSRDKNSQKNDECIEIDISGDEKSVSGNKSVGSIEENPWESPCSEKTNPAATKESFCCNDSLIKKVLAAKETLKKCLSKSGCESNTKNNSRPKTAAEKKQGSSFELNDVAKMRSKSSDALESSCGNVRFATGSIPAVDRHKTEIAEKPDKKHSQQDENISVRKKLKPSEKDNEELCSTLVLNSKETMRVDSKKARDATHECTTISLKAFRRFGQAASSGKAIRIINLNEERENITEQNDTATQLRDIRQREENEMSSRKISSHIPKSMDEKSNVSNNTNGIKSKEDNMPILEPEVAVSFDASSDRDNSRSPPVITNQDSGDVDVAESKLVEDKLVTLDDKVESNLKDIHKRSEMTITDFVTQLAYHEKATIKHRRYCNLCERWFPTTSRHRRHLAGYQHRHLELTQRRSIHALFMLFTGKPCPRLLPANVVRNDCSVGELTPLQIAVQDVTKCFDHVQQSPKKQNDVDK